jgi:FMN-dependent NADH-azoreductase
MAKLMYIEASPRKERSASIAVAKEFLRIYAETHPADSIETLDVWDMALPEFDGATINAKYNILHGQPHSDSEAKAWGAVEDICHRFLSADKYVFGVPMWNLGIPYKLKHFIDVITQPGLTFSFSPEKGYTGLVTGKPAVVIYSSGGDYGPASPANAYDFQQPYMKLFLGFIGITDVCSVTVAPTLAMPEAVKSLLDKVKEEAAEIAGRF